jgi:hypothetical protein
MFERVRSRAVTSCVASKISDVEAEARIVEDTPWRAKNYGRRVMTIPKRISFTVEDGEAAYACERIVTGARVLRQRIEVRSVGTKADSANYGPGGHPLSSMATTARLIAWEIIREQHRSRAS